MIEDVDRHGNVRIYVRRPGRKKVRISAQPGTDAFYKAYASALDDTAVAIDPKRPTPANRPPESLAWLCGQYFGSAEFKTLGPSTQKVRRQILDRFCQKDGSKPYALLENHHLKKRRDALLDTPEAANSQIKALRQVFKWAMRDDVKLATANPALGVAYLKPKNPDGIHTWTVEEVARFEERYPVGTKARLALALLLYTGVRRSDVIHLGRQMDRDGWLTFTEAKNRRNAPKHREILILPVLQKIIDATPSGHLTFLVTEHGKPFTHGGFGNWFRDRCDEAGLLQCSAHGLRKAGATIAAENGATEHELMAIYGWSSPKQAAHYTKKANRKRLAGNAMHLLEQRQDENKTVPPNPARNAEWDKSSK